jgi:hypothetical protein
MMDSLTHEWLSPKLEARPHPKKGGYGIFAVEPVLKDDLLVVWGGGIFTWEELAALPEAMKHLSIQVEEGLYLVTTGLPHQADYINHSCDPNVGMSGQIAAVAMRDIAPGEEICIDYAMCDGSPYDEFICRCGAAECRGRVTGDDWGIPQLWDRYAGYFSPYLQRRIDHLREQVRLDHAVRAAAHAARTM